MNLRKFIMVAFSVIMLAAAVVVGDSLVKEAQATNLFISGHMGAGAGPGPYSSWNEDTEQVTDVDYCMKLENPVVGNETGYSGTGVLTGADLIGTQAGNIAGSPDGTYRQFDTTDDKMTWTDTCKATCLNQPTWLVLGKCQDLEAGGALDYIFFMADNSPIDQIYLLRDTTITFYVKRNNVALLNGAPAVSPATNVTFYWAVGCDGTTIRAGWATSKITDWNSVPANNKISAVSACDFSGSAFLTAQGSGINTYNSSAAAKWHWIIYTSDVSIIANW